MSEKKIVLIHGKKRSGKDYIASLIKKELESCHNIKAKKLSLAYKMKVMISSLFNISLDELEEYKNKESSIYLKEDNEYKKILTFREILQRFGTEVMKNTFGEDIWIRFLIKEIKSSEEEVILIPDIRFEEELRILSGLGSSYTIYIESKSIDNNDQHISEKGLPKKFFSYYFDNSKKNHDEAKHFAAHIADKIFIKG